MKLFLSFPVPRQFWDDKPDAIARTVVKEVNVQGVPEGFNIGPGLLGHCANDNPWIARPAVLRCVLALFLRLLDEMIVVHPNNPFVVLPVGAAIGQIMGLARRDGDVLVPRVRGDRDLVDHDAGGGGGWGGARLGRRRSGRSRPSRPTSTWPTPTKRRRTATDVSGRLWRRRTRRLSGANAGCVASPPENRADSRTVEERGAAARAGYVGT
ncbi:MAG: hypothetical protein V9F04_01160 [Dermatophilaceae bacterium]